MAAASALLLAVTAGCAGDDGGGGAGATEQADGGPATSTSELPEGLLDQQPDWSSCPAPDERQGTDARIPREAARDVPWECATLTVPRDYGDPEGGTLTVALIRAAATGDEDRAGSLVFNFGGPGGSGVVTLPAFASEYRALHARYDLVSFDPRGVGASEGVVCLDDAELDSHFADDLLPRDDADGAALEDRAAEFASACDERAGELLPHLTTVNTARDLDLLRHVLGDGQLNYFGVSYGTLLGGVYAHLFPEQTGRMVFDAVVDPDKDEAASALGQAAGFQRAFGNYLESCQAEDECPLGGSPEEGEEKLTELLDSLRDEPLPTRDPDRELTASLAWAGIAQSLYSEDFWPYLTEGLDDALDADRPDGTMLLTLGDAMNGRSSDGTYSTLQSSLTAIRCADTSARHSVSDVREQLPEFTSASPVFGESMAWSLLSCHDWPVTGRSAAPDVSAPGAGPIVLVGTTGDPATPYEGTAAMRDALGAGVAVEITFDGEGHGAYTSGSTCVRDAVNSYLLDGMVPEDGLVCG